MRAVAVHDDVLVVVSEIWQTTATVVRAGAGSVLIDSPVLPSELAALPGVLGEAGFAVSGLLATHGDWDHLLGCLAFPDVELRAGASTVARLGAEPGVAQAALDAFDARHYVCGRPALVVHTIRPILASGGTFELVDAPGHTADGAALWLPWARVLVCGDYLSPVEIPMISAGGSQDAYRATLDRLAPLLELAETVVPGHGEPMTAARARAIWAEDVTYLTELDASGEAALPAGRDSAEQERIHGENVARLVALAPGGGD